MPRFDEWLEEKLGERGWTAADLNRASRDEQLPRGLDPGLIGRWRKPPPHGVVPNHARTLRRIARAFSVTDAEVWHAAGLMDSDVAQLDASDPLTVELRQRTTQMYDLLHDIPRVYWAPILKAYDRAIDAARDMAALLTEQQSQPRTAKNRVDTRATGNRPGRSTGANRGGGKLRLPERVAAFALAGA
jgi:hypothetical protein